MFKRDISILIIIFLSLCIFPIFGDLTIDERGISIEYDENIVTHEIYLISIGVDKFEQNEHAQNYYPNLNYCVADAKSIYESFSSIEDENKLLLIDEYATMTNIMDGLNNIIAKMNRNDLLILYVATHGMFDENDYYFTPSDFDFTNFSYRGISSNWLIQELSFIVQNNSNNVVLFLDTCHSGAFGFDIRKSYNAETRSGLALVFSCSPLELSFEGLQYGGGHGLFSYAILEGLSGNADKNNNGNITFRELFDYAYLKVKELSNDRQNPVFIGAMENSVIIKRLNNGGTSFNNR